MRAVDVHVHRREAVGKTLRDETLSGEVITLVEIIFTENVEDTGVTFETRRMQRHSIDQVSDTAEPLFGCFEGDPAHEAVDFVAEAQEVVSEITAVLARDSSNQRSLRHKLFLRIWTGLTD
jgi:hypothetical protein